MATYKVLQDIEAEDKLIGPLTLRQFIYAGIAAVFLYISYLLATKGAVFMLPVFLPIVAVCGFFAFPWMRDQPTEVWALAKIRFLLKPRRRVWDQSSVKELVSITVPKQVATNYTNGLSQNEVRSRLRALASTIDTRGWAVKNANLNMQTEESDFGASDRLVAPAVSVSAAAQDSDIRASDDILDEQNNASAQRLQTMIDQKSRAKRQELMSNLQSNQPAQPKPKANDYWFLNQPAQAAKIPSDMVTFNTQVVTPGAGTSTPAATAPVANESDILAELDVHKQQSETAANGHMHTIKPLSAQPKTPPKAAAKPTSPPPPQAAPINSSQNASASVTPAKQTAILNLANNDDLDVATIAREAQRAAPQNEVVIKLH